MTSWQNIVNTVKQYGHPLLVLDDDETMVVMKLADYDKLLEDRTSFKHLSEEEMLAEINKKIADWRAGQDMKDETKVSQNIVDIKEKSGNDSSDEDTFYIEPVV